MEHQHEEAIQHLKAFFREMRQWQINCKKLSDEEDTGTITREEFTAKTMGELRLIYDKYCEYKKFPNNITFSYTPAYDPEKEGILEVFEEKEKVIVITDRQSIVPRLKLKYTIKKTKDGYRILMNRKRFDEFKKEYVPWDLLL